MLDRHSEIIAHFIGIFDQAAEQSLYRLQYDAFRAQDRPADEPGSLLDVNVRISSPLAPDRFDPSPIRVKDSYTPHTAKPGEVEVSAESNGLGFHPVAFSGVWNVFVPNDYFAAYPFYPTPVGPLEPGTPVYIAPTPGSIITFVYQQNIAQDNDILLMRPLDIDPELAATRTDAAFSADLMALARAADALAPGDFVLGREYIDTETRIKELIEVYDGVEPAGAPEGAQVTLVSHLDGNLPESGILVDGVAADALPDTLQLALAARRADETGEEEPVADEGDADEGVVHATVIIGPDGEGPYQDAPQYIEAGNNLLMNHAVSGLGPVDAPLIAVAGVAMTLIVINQVNVMSDRDMLVGQDASPYGGADPLFEDGASQGHNIASVHWEGSVGGSPAGAEGGPQAFAIAEIEGDLVLTTHVFQLNLITDNDVITFATTYHQVEIGTGGNISTDLLEQLGYQFGFDMILVGGDMLNLVSMSQLNLLYDNDLVVNEEGVGADIHTSGNLLWNEAAINWHGVDSAADEMSEASGQALETMAGGQLDLEALKSEELLEGKEMPLLLTISGDLIFDYRLEQINILADADTVQLFADAAVDHGLNPVEVATGDNVLANVASLDVYGMDSTIMAGGEVYSDLVIHQAGMYDTDDTPLETDLSDPVLASEAVVFLADGMIDDGLPEEPVGGEVIVDTGGNSGAFDTLGGMVA